MAAKTSTTRIDATEPLNRLIRLDRLEFRKLLDLYYKALRADWVYHENRSFGLERLHSVTPCPPGHAHRRPRSTRGRRSVAEDLSR